MSSIENGLIFDFKTSMEVYNNFKKFYNKRPIPSFYNFNKSLSNDQNLTNLSLHLLNVNSCTCTLFAYKPLIIELLARLIHNPQIERSYLESNKITQTLEGIHTLTALSLILSYTQEVSILTEHFLISKDFFHALKNCTNSINQFELQTLLLSFYRLINTDREKFYKFIDPQILHSLISNDSTSNINKYISIHILSKYLFLSEIVRNQMIQKNIDESNLIGQLDGDNNINFKFLSLLEAQRLSNLSKLTPIEDCFIESSSTIVFNQSDLSPGVNIISGIMLTNLISLKSNNLSLSSTKENNFVEIPKSLESIRSFAKCIKTSKPLLLIGSAGSGKTFLVDEMARRLQIEQANNLVKIHLNQQTDSKTLLGTYTSGTKPGIFEWKNGVLTTAVKEGKWVLIEDIDKAPNEVLSILMGLLEHRQITLPSRGEVFKAGNGFQLISTIRIKNNSKNEESQLPDMIGSRLWEVLNLKDLNEQDLKTILNRKFKLLTRYTNLFINCYFTVKSICDSRRFVSMNKGAQPREISIRDLMKFCRRSEHIFKLNDIESANDLIHDDVFDTIFQEAIDCFTNAIVEKEPIEFLIREIGSILEIPSSRIELHLSKNVPSFENYEEFIKIGRAHIEKQKIIGAHKYQNIVANGNITSFATTNHSARLMEKIGVGISMCEPLLLVGETGTGKTTVVQQMAKMLNKKLTVINLSQQTEVGDLLGGFKPINAKTIALPLEEDFEQLFARSFSTKNNSQFLKLLSKCFNKSQWKNVCRLWKEAYKMAKNTFEKIESDDNDDDNEAATTQKKKRKLNNFEKSELMKEWKTMQDRVINFEKQVIDMNNSFLFRFVEGSLVNAVKKGDWLLLDEMNLAAPETLDSISDLLAEYQDQRSVLLSEKGDVDSIKAHPEFRIFGCMNPATDVGKKDLPQSIRSRFTEIYVASPDQDIEDLLMIIDKYIGKYALSDEWIGNDIAELYLTAKKLSDNNQIVDGANQKPHFSIRTLTRTLLYACEISPIYGLRRSLYEGFCMSLLTLLDAKSEQLLLPLIHQYTIGKLKNAKSVLSQIPSDPSTSTSKFIQFKHYWMQKGMEEPEPQAHYIITPFVEKNMMNLVRAISGGRFPVLIQGPTSAGKTSMINHLAKITGHKFVRINNHEHTDLQEYLGTYVSDDTGKLSFKEGILVEALRKGHWIVLDELNLAPTDVLEALNRLLDDNRELFIPETQEIVRPHPDFMLFATQNPPGLYGGRKVLSKAFRNRFLELHFDDIPQDELEIILRERCQIAPSYAKKIVEVYKELGLSRQSARLFEQKNSFATLRDLFRWAQREAVGYEQLAANGYMLLAERVRRPEEKVIVKQALENVMRVKLNMDEYYSNLEIKELFDIEGPVIWTKAMRRLAVLVMTSMQNNEPLLLVGETGCGKTTVCQMIAKLYNKGLIIVNAHQNTETGDLLGAQRPIRNRSELQIIFVEILKQLVSKAGNSIPDDISYSDAIAFWNDYKKNNEVCADELKVVEKAKTNCEALFEWNDGPLINAMKSGSYFLLDEISLADDSVLERLNSVLEPERSLLLAEKGTDDIFITADEGFQFLATMNPGGDYGKKELSPALRNRFTEIWVPSMEDFEDVRQIVRAKLCDAVKHLTDIIVNFSRWYGNKMGGGDASSGVISLRDILAWITFINIATENGVSDMVSLLHGSCMVFIDALGTHSTAYLAENEEKLRTTKLEYVKKLSEFAKQDLIQIYCTKYAVEILDSNLVSGPFKLERNENAPEVTSFNLAAPTTASNAMRVIRALQVNKPILLEGSPGVGKTSLITALAQATGNNLTRINLSEQTDLIDLFGSDSPVEGGKAGEFVWRDAPYLRAMQKGEWVLLDEMNLASQSVLEGLNACLDHRGEVYIPELDKSFISHPNFKVFAAQNPQLQGGGRKGLPKSFINRFSVVYVDMLTEIDLKLIAHHLYPLLDTEVCDKMISFMSSLEEQVVIKKEWGSSGAPWEFNLRDTLRWLSLIESPNFINKIIPSDFFDLVVKQRFRTNSDRQHAVDLFETIFGTIQKKDPYYLLQDNCVQCENVVVKRNDLIQYQSDAKIANLQCNVPILETIFRCIQHAYPLILVGASGSGKSNLIKFVADVIGSKVYEFSMNSDIDSMDILGGYEQADFIRTLSKYSNRIFQVLLKLIAVNVQLSAHESKVIVQIATKLIKFLNDSTLSHENIRFVLVELNSLNDIVQNQEINEIINALNKINESVLSGEISVNFEWFDGLLVEAVEKGYWLILDNANLCSPSVLDRLNSLLETNGSLIINECTNDDGSPRVIKTHPNFRLFLTSDPKYGELSRAMRNRSVEVYVDSLDARASIIDRNILGLPQQFSIGDESLNNELKSLGLKVQGKPIACYSLVSDSFLFSNSLFLDYYNTAISLQNSFAASALLQFIPISLLDLAFEFSTTASNASEFLNSSFFINIHNQINVLLQSGLIDTAHTLYDKAAASSPLLSQSKLLACSNQPVSLLTNSYILPLVKEYASFVDSCENSYLFAVLSMSSDAFIFMNDLHEKATTVSASILNPLEKLAAVSLGREIKNVPKLNVYQWLVQVLSFIKNQTSALIKSKDFLNVDNCFASLFSLLVLWNNFVSSAKTLNYTAIRVYHDQLSEWYKDNISTFETGLFVNLNEFITFFSAELKLSRGSSMTIIWNACRGVYPQTAVAWKNYESLVKLASKFDKIAFEQFPENIPNVNKFREMFIQLFASCLEKSQKDDFDGMLKLIELKIDELEHISDEFLNKRSHSFVNNFAELLGFIESQKAFEKKGIELDHKTLTLCLLANKPTVEMVEHNKIELFKPYPMILKSLWSVDGTLKLPLFDDNFFKSTMSLVSEIEQTKGGDIEQTLHDLKFFISQMIASSPDVLSDHLSAFASILKEWIFYIHTIHLGLLESDSKSAAETLFTESSSEAFSHYVHIFKSSGNDSYASIFETYFVPSLQLLKQDLTLKSLGESYIFSACGFIMLYMPDSAYDPAAVDHILYNDFIQLQNVIGNIREAFIVGRENYFGDGKILADDYLPEIPQNNINEVPRVFRDSEPTERLFEEWQIFFTSYIDKQHISFLLRTASELTDKADAQINNFTKNATHFILRLKENHMKFSDLNDILIGFIYSLKLGIHLLHYGHNTANISLPSLLWSSDATVIYSPHKLENIFEHVQTFTKKCSVNDYNVESICSYLLLLFKIYKNPRRVEKENDTFNKVLMTLYYRWSLRTLKQKEKESTESGVFKYEDPTMDAEADFKKLFPDSDDVIDVTASETHSSEQDLNEMYYIIAKAYVTYFKPDLTTSFDDISKNAISAFNSLQKIITVSGNNRNKGSILVFILSLLKDSYNKFTNIKSSSEIDFYRGYDFAQTRAAGKVIRNVQISVAELLKKWPEHATLSELFRISTEFLEYPASTPIFRLLSKVEQIFTFIAEWEKYAHSGVSLNDHYKSVSGLIVSWRQLELASWKQVFVNEENNIEKSIGKWWFYLFESIILPTMNDQVFDEEIEIKVIAAINIFISQATYGEFSYRLDLIGAFASHVKQLTPLSSINNSLLNIVNFYKQFISQINESIAATKKDLEKKVNEVILLASWKDVNIDALKQSSRRSHHKLYSIIRKYRDCLVRPVKPLIEAGLSFSVKSQSEKSTIQKRFITLPEDIKLIEQLCSEVKPWNSRVARLKNISQVEKNMNLYVNEIGAIESRSLHEYAKEIFGEADRLRKETPSIYTKEKKKLIASLKTEKYKLMSNTITDLKTMGLKLHMTLDIQKALPSSTAILATSKSLENTSFRGCDAYFFRMLDLLPRLRLAVSEVHTDIPPADAQKCLTASEHLLFNLLKNRTVLFKFDQFNSSLSEILSNLETFTTTSENKLIPASQLERIKLCKNDFRYFIQHTPVVLDYAIESLQNSSEFTTKSYNMSVFINAKSFMKKYSVSEHELIGSIDQSQFQELLVFYNTLVDNLNEWKSTNLEVKFVADFVLDWLVNQSYKLSTQSVELNKFDSLDDLEFALRELFNSILVSVQRIHKFNFKDEELNNNDENDAEDDESNWLIKEQKKLNKFVDLLYPVTILKRLNKCLELLQLIEYSEHESRLASAMLEHTLPIVQHYFNLVQIIQAKLHDNYIDISRGCYELSSVLFNICSKGFCQPEPPTDEKEDNNLKDGTGLGDGEGAENNSNDVEDDEDLSEQAQQPNEDKDKDDKEEDENDDAVDIKGDMAGDLENLSDQENEDDDAEEEKDEEELDEEIDDLDDMDPNAVDDKMWDEEASSNSKEKESENMPDNSEENNDMEAMEEDAKENESKENNTNDQDKNDDDNNGEEEKENDEGAEEEEDVGEQEDEVKNEENDQFDNTAPEANALDLPEDMNLDSEGDESEGDEENDDRFDDNLDDNEADIKDDDEEIDEKADVEMDKEEIEGDEETGEVEGAPADDNEGDEDNEDNEEETEADNMEVDNEEINEDAGEESEQELKDGAEENEDDSKDKNENDDDVKQEEIEGLEGTESGANDVEDDSAVKQQSGIKSEGADADANEENENIGASNGGADFQNEEQENTNEDEKTNEQNESSRDQAAESMKQLGDSLKEFYRRRQEIKEATDDDLVDQKAGERPDEFQHLEGDNADNDTQALGAANKDQVQTIDDNMEIDDEEEENFKENNTIDDIDEGHVDNNEKNNEDIDMHNNDMNEDNFVGEKRSGFMSERNREIDELPTNMNMEIDSESEVESFEYELGNKNNKSDTDMRSYEEAEELWRKADEATRDLTSSLCEQLRLILEPTLSTKLKGDYKTGKRLNMKRIIPYIASQFRKDKIWMRRTKPSKRQYQIMISLDDSKSMSESHAVDIAFESVALVSKALSQLESGQLSIMKFGTDSEVVHPFEKQFGNNSGVNIFREFKFDDTRTDIKKLVSKSLRVFNEARAFADSDLWQLEIVLSDGVCEDHETIQRLVRKAREEKVMIVFVIIDGLNSKESILDMSQASYITDEGGQMKLQVNKYLDTFPFEFYVVVHHINELPEMLSLILRQYFTELASS